jgi:hypothetical protein
MVTKSGTTKAGKKVMEVRVSASWFTTAEAKREKICKAICSIEAPTEPKMKLMGGGGMCEVHRWTDGRTICEQWVCYDPMGMIIEVGPIMCHPIR